MYNTLIDVKQDAYKFYRISTLTRMTTFIKTKYKISDYQTNIELILQPIIITNFCGSENHLS